MTRDVLHISLIAFIHLLLTFLLWGLTFNTDIALSTAQHVIGVVLSYVTLYGIWANLCLILFAQSSISIFFAIVPFSVIYATIVYYSVRGIASLIRRVRNNAHRLP